MGKRSNTYLTLCSLLLTAICTDAVIRRWTVSYPQMKENWTEARLHCQRKHIDLVTFESAQSYKPLEKLLKDEVNSFWIGLIRDPENDRDWKWISITGEDASGIKLSRKFKWASGNTAYHCTVVMENDLMWQWHTAKCLKQYPFYCSSGNTIQYHAKLLTWYNASHHCRSIEMELATVTENNTVSINRSGWIGLEHIGGKTWSWIGGMQSDYRNWADSEPSVHDCVTFKAGTHSFKVEDCSKKHHAVCQADNLVVVKENKTWEEALKHCREMDEVCEDTSKPCTYKYSLLSLQDSDYKYVRERIYRATTDEVWTGLRFLGGSWWWVDGPKLTNKGQLPTCPSQQRHCGTLSKKDTNNWIMQDCSEKRNFLCHELETI